MDFIMKKSQEVNLSDALNSAAESKGISLSDIKGIGLTFLNGVSKGALGTSLEENKVYVNIIEKDFDKIASKINDVDKASVKAKQITEKLGFIIFGGSVNNEPKKKSSGFFTRISSTALKDANKVAAEKVKSNKNAAFKYGLGLIVCGALYGALMFPNMKSQFSQLIESGKPVMEKIFAALKLLVNASITFVPMALGALLLWFAYSEAPYDKNSMIDKIIGASVAFFMSVETALFGEAKPEDTAETEVSKEEKEAPKTEEAKAMIQQRIAMLQMDLAQIAHDLA